MKETMEQISEKPSIEVITKALNDLKKVPVSEFNLLDIAKKLSSKKFEKK